MRRFFNNFIVSFKGDAGIYAVEGLIIACIVNLITNNNNLFASRLGATDYELGMIQFAPQLATVLVLIPGGVIADSLSNKRKMVVFSMIFTGALYFIISFTPLLNGMALMSFILLISLSAGGIILYNISWQSFFPEVIPVEKRNSTLTLRTGTVIGAGIAVPLITGFILSSMGTNDAKIMSHRYFFIIGAVLVILHIFVLSKLHSKTPSPPKGVSLANLRRATVLLFSNKKFLFYGVVSLIFYATWHMDWTLFYIGQTKYLNMNESYLSYAVAGNTIIQFCTLKFWSKMNEKKGVVFPLLFGILGLACCPLSMIISTCLQPPFDRNMFLLLYTLSNLPFATINLNMFQCLLQVLDEEYRTLCISIYTIFVSLSNAIMPVVGVYIYQKLGADLNALHNTFWIVFLLRIFAAAVWLLRWYIVSRKKEEAYA